MNTDTHNKAMNLILRHVLKAMNSASPVEVHNNPNFVVRTETVYFYISSQEISPNHIFCGPVRDAFNDAFKAVQEHTPELRIVTSKEDPSSNSINWMLAIDFKLDVFCPLNP